MFNRPYFDPYIIAEIGIHHNGSLLEAMRLADAAKLGGAHAIKLQHYTAERLVHPTATAFWNTEFPRGEAESNQLALYSSHKMLDAAQMEGLRLHCCDIGIDLAATGFSIEDVDFIDPYVRFHKIASCDLTNIPLLRHVGSKGKPIVMSVGAMTCIHELKTALAFICQGRQLHGNTKFMCSNVNNIAILHCVLEYPTAIHNANLLNIMRIREQLGDMYRHPIGYSDHTLRGGEALQIATSLGARVLEKHFTITPNAEGADHYHGATTQTLLEFNAWRLRQSEYLLPTNPKAEDKARKQARRGIYASRDIKAGELLSDDNLITLRPVGKAAPASAWTEVIGTAADRKFKKGQPITIFDTKF